MSMESVCHKAGLGKGTIGMWARAKRVPNIGNMRAVLGALGFMLVAIKPAKEIG